MVPKAKADLVRWIRRFDAVEARIDSEHHQNLLTPDESLRRASSLRFFAERLGALPRRDDPSEEDLRVYRTWDRLRRALLPSHA